MTTTPNKPFVCLAGSTRMFQPGEVVHLEIPRDRYVRVAGPSGTPRTTTHTASGAPARAVVALVVHQGMILVGVLGAVGPGDPLTFVSVTLMLVVAGLVATYSPARRAACIDPPVALRHE